MRFSQRKSLTPVRSATQRDDIDAVLRNKLWSALWTAFFNADRRTFIAAGEQEAGICTRLWVHFFGQPIDRIPGKYAEQLAIFVRPWFMQCAWYEAYDLVEAIVSELKADHKRSLVALANSFLADEQSAYRIVDDRIAEIVSEQEIEAIEGALRDSHPLAGARTHLHAALDHLTDRKNPDFRNSIKESISAVESVCRALTGDQSVTLGKAVLQLKNHGIVLHPALEGAWSKLYGFSSDASGIRHALTDEPTVTHADAKYMLVTCSAFVSYLTEQAAEANIPLG